MCVCVFFHICTKRINTGFSLFVTADFPKESTDPAVPDAIADATTATPDHTTTSIASTFCESLPHLGSTSITSTSTATRTPASLATPESPGKQHENNEKALESGSAHA